MADLTNLQAADAALKDEVAAAVMNMDSLFQALQNAMTSNDQPAIDAVTADIQAEIDALKAAVTKDTVPVTPPPPPPPGP